MIIINGVKYESLYELCKAFDIDYGELIRFRTNNKSISELELLAHFLGNIGYSMKDGTYFLSINKSE